MSARSNRRRKRRARRHLALWRAKPIMWRLRKSVVSWYCPEDAYYGEGGQLVWPDRVGGNTMRGNATIVGTAMEATG